MPEQYDGQDREARQRALMSTLDERMAHVPKDGWRWVGDGGRGNSLALPSSAEAGAALAARGLRGIEYRDGIPDFSPVAAAQVQLGYMTVNRTQNVGQIGEEYGLGRTRTDVRDLSDLHGTFYEPSNMEQADILLAEQWTKEGRDGRPWTWQDVRKWRQENHYTWHELNDQTTMQLIPTEIHRDFTHLGGVAEVRRERAFVEEALRGTEYEDEELVEDPFEGMTDEEMEAAREEMIRRQDSYGRKEQASNGVRNEMQDEMKNGAPGAGQPVDYGKLTDDQLYANFRASSWNKLDDNARQALLQEVVNRSARAHGEQGVCQVAWDPNIGGALAAQRGSTIAINPDYLSAGAVKGDAAQSWEALESVLHEDEHAYQYQVCDGRIPNADPALRRQYQANNFDVTMITDAGGVTKPGLQYIAAEENGGEANYLLYYLQSTERDAHRISQEKTQAILARQEQLILEEKQQGLISPEDAKVDEEAAAEYRRQVQANGYEAMVQEANDFFFTTNFEEDLNTALTNNYYGENKPLHDPSIQQIADAAMVRSYGYTYGQRQSLQQAPQTEEEEEEEQTAVQAGYQAQTGGPAQTGFQPQTGYQAGTGFQPQTGYQAGTGFQPQTGYQAQTGFQPQTGYQAQTGFQPQTGYQAQTGGQAQAGQQAQPEHQTQQEQGYGW